MKTLHRKLGRDLLRMWSQTLTIALVVASGIGGFIMSLSAVDSLALARDRFYADARFADVFASVRNAPVALEARLREVPGVAALQTTVEQGVRIDIAGSADPVSGRLIGLNLAARPQMNRLTIARGQPLSARGASSDERIEVLVNHGFALARGLDIGSEVRARINGRQRTLRIVGTALSPEYVFAGLGGMPDLRGFGVFWMDRDILAAAFDMQGAFNRVAVRLAPGASEQAVVVALNALLAPHGGREAHGRKEQSSHQMLDNEIKEQRLLGTLLPAIFLAVAAFLLNVVVSRLVATQREQIATLKALGYGNALLVRHYLQLVMVIVTLGLALGVLAGDQLGRMFTGLYAEFFHFPSFEHHLGAGVLIISIAVTLVTAMAGTFNAILASARLPPAEAMRPAAPGRFRISALERLGLSLPAGLRMILRNMARRPWRSVLTVAGIAAAVAIVLLGNFIRDAIEQVVDSSFNLAMRHDAVLWLAEASDRRSENAIAVLPGVLRVEAQRDVQVRFQNGHRQERGVIQGLPGQAQLRRIIDVDGRAQALGGPGLVLTDRLADKLGVRTGDLLGIEVLEGRRRPLSLPVDAIVRDMMGLNAYMDREALNRALGDADLANGYAVAVERGRESVLIEASRSLPGIAGIFSKATLLRNMEDISARNIRIMSTMLTLFAGIIAVGVVYNNARIALAERTWELASLRVLGFTRGEVSLLLLGEMALAILIALPLGMGLGTVLVHLVTELLKSDQFYFPVTIRPRTYAWAALAVLGAGLASALVVRRRIDRLDMVAALKTRE